MPYNERLAIKILERLEKDLPALYGANDDYDREIAEDMFARYRAEILGSIEAAIWVHQTCEKLDKKLDKKLDSPAKPDQKTTVRVRKSFSGCEVLGEFVKETPVSFIYLAKNDKGEVVKKFKKKTAQARAGGRGPKPNPHIVPCMACLDHPESNYVSRPGDLRCSIHGSSEPCETCRST